EHDDMASVGIASALVYPAEIHEELSRCATSALSIWPLDRPRSVTSLSQRNLAECTQPASALSASQIWPCVSNLEQNSRSGERLNVSRYGSSAGQARRSHGFRGVTKIENASTTMRSNSLLAMLFCSHAF